MNNIQSSFDKRENLTTPVFSFPPSPKDEVEVPQLEHLLQVRTNMKKIVFSNIEEILEADAHKLEDIGEVNFLLQQ